MDRTHICAVFNQKGGVGKTSTVMNLAGALTKYHQQKVFLIDLDGQSSLSVAMGVDVNSLKPDPDRSKPGRSIYDVLARSYSMVNPDMESATINFGNNGLTVDLVPSDKRLANTDIAFAQATRREYLLKNAIKSLTKDRAKNEYDIILIDCSPNLGLLTLNALTAADSVLIPVQAEYLSLRGLLLTLDTIAMVKNSELNDDLQVLGFLLTMVNRTKLSNDVVNILRENYGNLVFKTTIRKNVALSEAPSNYKDIFDHNNNCSGAWDYKAFAVEFMSRVNSLKGDGSTELFNSPRNKEIA